MVLLTNSIDGGMLLGPFLRRLLDGVFHGKPQAVGDVASAAASHKAYLMAPSPWACCGNIW
jgi:hypothetical protein